ncbi:MAG: HIT family protein [Saprospiraceae bacterium]|nr:HIT family protein [Saprospiraceae bacterium]
MAGIFSKIIAGEIPCYKIAESEDYFAFLDIRPLQKGHTLVIPKREIDYVFDLEDDALAGLMLFAKRVGKAMKQVIDCKRIGVSIIGLEVPHTHIHLIPINSLNDMDFTNPIDGLEPKDFQIIAEQIAERFE